jgi:N-acetylglucosaminyldiphosphoundecaprenol N-acetyl-beta-D-mannosaminyltransferase
VKENILGVNFDTITQKEALQKALSFVRGAKPETLFTPNPEMVMTARHDKEFCHVLNSASMVVPDGIGIVYASKINKGNIKQRVAGFDLIQAIFSEIKKTGETVYFFGGGKGVAAAAKTAMEQTHKGIRIIGTQEGFFDKQKEAFILNDIKEKKPDILLVGLGCPKQEKWIAQHKDELPVKLLAGVGGSFDAMSGKVKRAPALFIRLNLEWLYRLIKQPSRLKRQIQLPVFMLLVIKERIARHGK